MGTVAEAFDASSSFGSVADAFAKSVDIVEPGQYGDKKVTGSMEHFLSLVRDPLVAGSACPYAGELDETGALKPPDYESGEPRHYPRVAATFSDKGIVSCDECKKSWAIPFTLDDDNVTTGEPEERIEAFLSPEHLVADKANPGDEEVVGEEDDV